MKEAIIKKRFNASCKGIVENANTIIAEHHSEGYTVTLRQLFYQFVQRGLIENKETAFKRLSNVISDGRMGGYIDWNGIEDRSRPVSTAPQYSDLPSFMAKLPEMYGEDLWANHSNHVEVWIEKDALVGTIERTCKLYRVPLFSCRGYASHSSIFERGLKLRDVARQGREIHIIQLGDCDPEGIHMSQDNLKRLSAVIKVDGAKVIPHRILLNPEQVKFYELPTNPKSPDTWELEALTSREINRLLMSSIADLGNQVSFMEAHTAEAKEKDVLRHVVQHWQKLF